MLREVANLSWQIDAPWFGGFSAIEVTGDGGTALLLSDRGSLVQVTLRREAGQLQGVTLDWRKPLRNRAGHELRGSARDAEGLALAPDGRAFASFEFRDHVARLDLTEARLEQLPTHPDFAGFARNKGIEALALHPDGTLYALEETSAGPEGTAALYAWDGARWRISHRLPQNGAHVPVGADFDCDGKLYLLEWLPTPLGFSSRIRVIDLTATPPLSRTLLQSTPGTYDNLEGLSLWHTPTGELRLIAVSDDNFLPFQRNQIVEFALTE